MREVVFPIKCISIYLTTLLLYLLTENYGVGGSGIKIRPSSCSNALGERGTCMFVWQCIKQEGEQLGPCVDRFLVGACCRLPSPHDNLVPGASGNSSEEDSPVKMKPLPSNVVSSVMLPMSTPELAAQVVISTLAHVSPTPQTTPAADTSKSGVKNPPVDNYAECGIQYPYAQSKVVGGTHSSFGQWPWQVSIRRASFFGFASTHRCGGAVLNTNWIATAAHCVDETSVSPSLIKNQIRVRVGEYDFAAMTEPLPYQERMVESKVVHPHYNFFTYEHDLALVRVDAPFQLQPHVRPICLPREDVSLEGRNGTVTGWGRLSEGGLLPSKLQQVQVPLLSNARCASMFQKAGRQETIPEIFLCAGYENGGRDSCQGDSGGPLQVRGEDGRWFLAGIISWGIGCAEPNMPGVCTRISKFTDWIKQTIS